MQDLLKDSKLLLNVVPYKTKIEVTKDSSSSIQQQNKHSFSRVRNECIGKKARRKSIPSQPEGKAFLLQLHVELLGSWWHKLVLKALEALSLQLCSPHQCGLFLRLDQLHIFNVPW